MSYAGQMEKTEHHVTALEDVERQNNKKKNGRTNNSCCCCCCCEFGCCNSELLVFHENYGSRVRLSQAIYIYNIRQYKKQYFSINIRKITALVTAIYEPAIVVYDFTPFCLKHKCSETFDNIRLLFTAVPNRADHSNAIPCVMENKRRLFILPVLCVCVCVLMVGGRSYPYDGIDLRVVEVTVGRKLVNTPRRV